ncbi:MAG: transcription antitermination factor NusB [Candidatus Melainabacteria bacterium]
MNARHAARELAILTLFQLERKAAPAEGNAPVSTPDIQGMVLGAVRVLVQDARDRVESAARDLAQVSQSILALELDADVNVHSAMDAPLQAAPLPDTRETVEKIERCLQAAEILHEALRLPELSAHAETASVHEYAVRLVQLVRQHRDELDASLNAQMDEWRMDRLARMDATILRVAVAEILYVDGVDIGVAINEAVDLAKLFGEPESYQLINGVLGAIARAIVEGRMEGSRVGGVSHA